MPILTNYEVAELRKMHNFACRLLDIVYSVDGNNGFDLMAEVVDIADELEIRLPLEKLDLEPPGA